MSSSRLLVVFDFDHTITDEDTFFAVHEALHTGKMSEEENDKCIMTRNYMPYERGVFRAMRRAGVSKEHMRRVVQSIPAAPDMEDGLRFLHQGGAELVIISDSNSVFIDYWLENKGLKDAVACVITNPASYDAEGCLNVDDYHHQDSCLLSNTNLCKGLILEEYLRERKAQKSPSHMLRTLAMAPMTCVLPLRLSSGDLVFPREGYALHDLILKGADQAIKASIHPWSTGKHILAVLADYVDYS